MLASWQDKNNKPYSSTSIKEIVENFYNKFQQLCGKWQKIYNKFQILCGKWQKIQEKLPTKPTEIFELPNEESLFFRQTPVGKEMDPRRAKLFAQARHILWLFKKCLKVPQKGGQSIREKKN